MKGRNETEEQHKQRLARALKANLARRKAQARTRKSEDVPPEKPESEDGCPN